MSPAMGDGDINDIHQKMSRKIAQLTKVVYNLNTKCEDQDSKIRYLIEKHHAEVKHLKQVILAIIRFFLTISISSEVALPLLNLKRQSMSELVLLNTLGSMRSKFFKAL